MNDTDLKTREQLAELLHISPRQIRRLEKEGLPVISIGNNTKRYDYEKVLEWLNEKNDKQKEIKNI